MTGDLKQHKRRLWDSLRAKKPHMGHMLTAIHLKALRCIADLRIRFDYPVSVVAGGNASGKSTALFAAACAYRVPGAGIRDFVPSTLLPDYRPRQGLRRDDNRNEAAIQFDYAIPDDSLSMRWRRSAKGWSRSFLGRKRAAQPERQVYLRTLSNPSEVRGVLSMSRSAIEPEETPMTALQIDFAQRFLPFRYTEVVDLSNGKKGKKGKKTLLFAVRQDGPSYSELHMAAGERALLRLSREIAQFKGALVLIDEVEAGLHPWVQELLMLHLQQLALRNGLQVIVTSHSPVVLDSVPPDGRIFLERGENGRVEQREPYRDVVQDALYGRSEDALKLLCEDEAAKSVLLGVFDVLLPRLFIRNDAVRVECDTGANEFPMHAAALRKFGRLWHFVFVLDGDRRDGDIGREIAQKAGSAEVPVLYLPGEGAPEQWVWERLRQDADTAVSKKLGIDPSDLSTRMERLDATYDMASDASAKIAKTKLRNLSRYLQRSAEEVCRVVAGLEAGRPDSDAEPLVASLHDILLQWRARED